MSASNQEASPSIEHLDVSESLTIGQKIALGRFSDLYEGSLERGDQRIKVAVKELRVISQIQDDRFRNPFFREVNKWRGLNHPNIVPFLGYSIVPENGPRLITPWYENGNLEQYLGSNSDANKAQLLLDILHGMQYLQSRGMVHGDLKSVNVLVDKDGRACLCDFWATEFLELVTGFTTNNQNATAARRFLSPERLQVDGPATIESDIWAFGCIVIEVIARRRPYEQFNTDHLVYTAIVSRQSPLNPNYDTSIAPGRVFWDFIKRCWKFDPKHRPTIDELLNHIGKSFLDGGHSQPENKSPRFNWSLIKGAGSLIGRKRPRHKNNTIPSRKAFNFSCGQWGF